MEQTNLEKLDKRMKDARIRGALFHPTNPADSWMCPECDVFGKTGDSCWCCGSILVEWQYVPRFGGGAMTVIWDETTPTGTVSTTGLYF